MTAVRVTVRVPEPDSESEPPATDSDTEPRSHDLDSESMDAAVARRRPDALPGLITGAAAQSQAEDSDSIRRPPPGRRASEQGRAHHGVGTSFRAIPANGPTAVNHLNRVVTQAPSHFNAALPGGATPDAATAA